MLIQSFLSRGKWHLGEDMMSNILVPQTRKIDNCDLSGKLKSLNAECRNCAPITPFECLSGCRVYLLKSELRHLWETMANPDYKKELFNVLKNKPRLHVMQAIVKGTYSSSQLQQEIERAGHDYRQDLLSEECLPFLLEVGLAARVRDNYHATTLGIRLTKLFDDFLEFADKLPTHSACYEEALLQALLSGPKTFEDIEALVAPKNVSRTLKRLSSAGLVETPKARAYIFFFRTIRDPNKETLTKAERKVCDTVGYEGISAGELAKETGLSLRRTYKYIRTLKGKKLVFMRKSPKAYDLTCSGKKLALVLKQLQQTVEETWSSSQPVMRDNQIILEAGGLSKKLLLH
jgi:DNA-binding HxlR family transcriptional regulator/predicted transcriptional regulator